MRPLHHITRDLKTDSKTLVPFPGKWPTRWVLGVVVDGKKRWTYRGKPSREALTHFLKLLRNAKAPIAAVATEFDRGGVLFRKTAMEVPRDPLAWVSQGHIARAWSAYHPWEFAGLVWVFRSRELIKLQTPIGVRRFYRPLQPPANWQEIYRRSVLNEAADPDED